MNARTCIDCGITFLAEESWKKRCLGCWRRTKDGADGWSGGVVSELSSAQRRIQVLTRRLAELDAELKQRRQSLTPERIRQLLMLCHPDRHSGSALANTVTAWLLALRQ